MLTNMITTKNLSPRVIIVGSINTDLVVTTERFPAPGETLLGGLFRQVGGGKGANQAVAAARLGASVTMIARVGEDSLGDNAKKALLSEGIDCQFVQATPRVATGVALITVQEGTGENNIIVVPGANAALRAEDVEAARATIITADIVVLSLEVPLEAIEAAAWIATEAGVPVVLNPAPARPLSRELLRHVSVLIPNESEARLLANDGAADRDAIATELSDSLASGGMTVITLGANGVFCAPQNDAGFSLPAPKVAAVDTVGAGDCFTASLAVALAEKQERATALRFALTAAALAVTQTGAQDAMPYRPAVESLL